MENKALSSSSDELTVPPSDTSGWTPNIVVQKRTDFLYRNHRLTRHPLHYGYGNWRFDAPNEEFGTCYFGTDPECSFIETFLHEGKQPIITDRTLASNSLALVGIKEPLKLLDLTGHGAFIIGADQRISTRRNYSITRAWSLAIDKNHQNFDGILYSSRNNNSIDSVAVFERAAHKVDVVNTNSWLLAAYISECFRILRKYQVEYVETDFPVSL